MTSESPDNPQLTESDSLEQTLASGARVMMVDDEPILIELVRAFLDEARYTDFTGIEDPTVAIKAIQEQKPDVLLLDLMMPEVNGFEILEQVKASPETRMMPVIVMTSASDADTKLKVLEMGATDFLEKPVDPSELILRLRNTMAFKAHRDRLNFFDALTNLPNRRLFSNQLESAVRRSRRKRQSCALVQIDISGVKRINETVGRRVGDQVVQIVAKRLLACIEAFDAKRLVQGGSILARTGGDEFSLLINQMESVAEVEEAARLILRTVTPGIPHDGLEFFLTSTIGIASCPMDAAEVDQLLQSSQAALANARRQGKNRYGFFSADLNEQAFQRLQLEHDLRKALQKNEFEVHYQPKVSVSENRICGAEALLRWNHPEHGEISPDQFVPMAEELGLITEIGTWVLEQACAEAVRWANEGISDCTVAVNIAAPHFADSRLLDDVQRTLESTGLPPGMLTIELTESMMMIDTEETLTSLERLRTLGIRTALDDFGTGFSSLSYLKRMRLNELKIDRSFIAGIPDDTDSSAIVRAVLAMSRSLGFEVVAEGVEQEEQLEFLRQFDCDVYQGFLCSQPIPAENFLNLLRREYVPRGLEVSEQ
ncbi:MAG: EAL domain-containing protein [Burkholderiaceae bacterium]